MHDLSLSHELATVDGLRLHYVTAGSGPPVLLWHGFLGTWFSWRRLIPLLTDSYTVIAPDMRGYGDSAKPLEGYDAATLAHDFELLLDQLDIDAAHVVAHDMGAPPALWLAANRPARVRTLSWLEEPVPGPAMREMLSFSPDTAAFGGLWWFWFNQSDLAEVLIAGKERQFLSWFYRQYSYDPTAITEADVDEYTRTFAGPGGIRGALGVYRWLFQTEAQLAGLAEHRIDVPVLAVGGALSMGDHAGEMMRGVASDVRAVTLERCGHFIAEERPDKLAELLHDFLPSR